MLAGSCFHKNYTEVSKMNIIDELTWRDAINQQTNEEKTSRAR